MAEAEVEERRTEREDKRQKRQMNSANAQIFLTAYYNDEVNAAAPAYVEAEVATSLS